MTTSIYVVLGGISSYRTEITGLKNLVSQRQYEHVLVSPAIDVDVYLE